jgi:molybdenum cofactor biosynthesis enzyme MoaA
MSIKDYKNLVQFILKNPTDKIGIIGGEPTLHPNFIDIIKITKEASKNKPISLYTNGIELKKFLPFLDKTKILLNYNNPKDMSNKQYIKLQDTLDTIHKLGWFANKTVTIGCNIHLNDTNYDYIWNAVRKYSLSEIRCSVVSPGGIYKQWRNNKNQYFIKLKPIFLNFCQNALIYNCKLVLDCSYIPLCYFDKTEMEIISSSCVLTACENNCPTVIDFTTDGKVTSCFGAYYPIEFFEFNNTQELSFYLFNNYKLNLIENNNQGKCLNCNLHQNKQCQGGCLAFSSLS